MKEEINWQRIGRPGKKPEMEQKNLLAHSSEPTNIVCQFCNAIYF